MVFNETQTAGDALIYTEESGTVLLRPVSNLNAPDIGVVDEIHTVVCSS